jgi:hypothetical protein
MRLEPDKSTSEAFQIGLDYIVEFKMVPVQRLEKFAAQLRLFGHLTHPEFESLVAQVLFLVGRA